MSSPLNPHPLFDRELSPPFVSAGFLVAILSKGEPTSFNLAHVIWYGVDVVDGQRQLQLTRVRTTDGDYILDHDAGSVFEAIKKGVKREQR